MEIKIGKNKEKNQYRPTTIRDLDSRYIKKKTLLERLVSFTTLKYVIILLFVYLLVYDRVLLFKIIEWVRFFILGMVGGFL